MWDQERRTIVNNELSEIIRMLNSAFDGIGASSRRLLPGSRCGPRSTESTSGSTPRVNNGVYRAGFATTQAAYDEAVTELFATLDWLEERLARQRYLMGDRITEADWRLFTTLLRFDPVYHGHFKCNLRRLVDYPNLWAYTRELYQWPGVAETVDFAHIKRHYYASHGTINPTGIVPKGPLLDFSAPHGRDRLAAPEPACPRQRPLDPVDLRGTWMRAAAGFARCGLLLALAGCAAVAATRRRPAGGRCPGSGRRVDRERLVGTWHCRDLNPYPDQIDPDRCTRPTPRTARYRAESRAGAAAAAWAPSLVTVRGTLGGRRGPAW